MVFKTNNKQEIWIDGKLINSRTPSFSGGIGNSDRYFQIGAKGWWSSDNIYFHGLIDELCIYSEALSSTQIKANYYAGLKRLLAKGRIDEQEYKDRYLGSNNLADRFFKALFVFNQVKFKN